MQRSAKASWAVIEAPYRLLVGNWRIRGFIKAPAWAAPFAFRRSHIRFFCRLEKRPAAARLAQASKGERASGTANVGKNAAKHLQDAPASCKKPRASARRAPVAQLDRALPSEGRGQGFESLRVRQLNQTLSLVSPR